MFLRQNIASLPDHPRHLQEKRGGAEIASTDGVGFTKASWMLARARTQASLLVRMGPRTLVAYLRLAEVILSERLWRVPQRQLRGGGSAPIRHTGERR
jgi:hypothetical protein